MDHCNLCALHTHCPTPALRAQEDYDFRTCAFFRPLTRLEYSEKLGREWAQAHEAKTYMQSAEWNRRWMSERGGSAHKGVAVQQLAKTPVNMEDYID